MFLTIENVLDEDILKTITSLLEQTESWVDGKTTAGIAASQVKVNEQLHEQSTTYHFVTKIIRERLEQDYLFKAFALPQEVHSLLVSKTTEGGKYGEHVDNAFISGKRTDLSFTIFLNNPRDYEGGSLSSDIFDEVKLNAGDMIVYPSSTLHEVTEVTSGTRLVCCGWVTSKVKDPSQRGLLFDLHGAKMSLLAKQGKTEEFDLVCKAHNNLLRMWSS